MRRIVLCFKTLGEEDRWFYGDRHWRPFIRTLIRGRRPASGVAKVAINLCKGLTKLGREYVMNIPFSEIAEDETIGVLGQGPHCLAGYHRRNAIVAGPAVITHPSEWPDLCEVQPISHYLQPSEWANNIFVPYYKDRCTIWPVGIDTEAWLPDARTSKPVDFLVYDKIMWDYERVSVELKESLLAQLGKRGLSYELIRYGSYQPEHYRKALGRVRAMIFLCEHESQGIAYQECLASDVPILAWDQGWWLDPSWTKKDGPPVPATSVPYWDERCGVKFRGIEEFPVQLDVFLDRLKHRQFAPRSYILEHLTLEQCAARYAALLDGEGQGQ